MCLWQKHAPVLELCQPRLNDREGLRHFLDKRICSPLFFVSINGRNKGVFKMPKSFIFIEQFLNKIKKTNKKHLIIIIIRNVITVQKRYCFSQIANAIGWNVPIRIQQIHSFIHPQLLLANNCPLNCLQLVKRKNGTMLIRIQPTKLNCFTSVFCFVFLYLFFDH